MRYSIYQLAGRRHQSAQIIALFVLFLVVLILIVGLGIDLGFVYITKAQLSKAVDAACLTALAHYSEGETPAKNMAWSAFRANYGVQPGRDAVPAFFDVTFDTTAAGNIHVNATANTTVNTFFIRVLPQWRTMRIADNAQAIRANAIITLVLDRSGSMDPNLTGTGYSQGGAYLPHAVQTFIQHFDDSLDKAALVSYASTAITDVSMRRPFKSTIISTANNLNWSGGTFAQGGLTNALLINNAVTIPSGQTALKVIVFFTDGMPNMVQNNLRSTSGNPGTPCTSSGSLFKPWVFGGRPNAGDDPCFWPPNASMKDQDNATCCTPGCCGGGSYPSVNGQDMSFTMPHIWLDASNRCVQVANDARATNMIVYAIGLDKLHVLGTPQKTFLNLVANDPESPAFNRNLPIGIAFNVGNGSDIEGAFEQVAADILLRLIE